ncbi:hypothetical protein B0T26DRAFT_745632 [Lasiosphaeria miniovina]|uniref:DUF7905 domain-containing protein n=1 Tax=Lasiosphaeria miniovina TaxID=1954250 RepID=A0AA40BG31_9PEZI|nr:uncharacterized protein B0T26DRAFT_745632 [Lasiosphaeria miniovina]KAK0733599.1 hypothetical protein B0T26DRAFT_745632 [Lasiosphaeria miniovina]
MASGGGSTLRSFSTQSNNLTMVQNYKIKLEITLTLPAHGYKDVDPSELDLQTIINQIAQKFKVHIEMDFDESDAIMTVFAPNKTGAHGALNALRNMLVCKSGEKSVWHPFALVRPPRSCKENMKIVLSIVEGKKGSRPTAKNAGGPKSSDADPVDKTQEEEYKEELKKALAFTVQNLKHVPNKMRMRVHFGTFRLKEWKKGQTEYTFSELESIAEIAEALRSRVASICGSVPRTVRSDSVDDIKPVHSLVIITKNLHVELGIDTIQTKGWAGQVTYAFGPPAAFRREKRARAIEILNSCPEGHYDWILEIHNQIDRQDFKAAIPFRSTDVRNNFEFTNNVLPGGFPAIIVLAHFMNAFGVEGVLGRTTWSYMLNSEYCIEISIYHKWGSDTKLPPTTSTGVTLYGSDWDDDMDLEDLSTAPRKWNDFGKQFLHVDGPTRHRNPDTDPYDDFLNRVRFVGNMLDEAADEVASSH